MQKTTIAIILAGGSGSRFGGDIPKQFYTINNKSIIQQTIEILAKELNLYLKDIIIVLPTHTDRENQDIKNKFAHKNIHWCDGGETRLLSTYNAIKLIKEQELKADNLLIHDAARPYLNSKDLYNLLNKMNNRSSDIAGYILAEPIYSTIKEISPQNKIIKKTHTREYFYLAQTPQIFDHQIYIKCIEDAIKNQCFTYTDDSSLLEAYQYKIGIEVAKYPNPKITIQSDLIK